MRRNDLRLKMSLVKAVDLLYTPIVYSVDSTTPLIMSPKSKMKNYKQDHGITSYSRTSIGTAVDSNGVGGSQVEIKVISEQSDKKYQPSKHTLSQESFNEENTNFASQKFSSMMSLINPYSSDGNQLIPKFSSNSSPRKFSNQLQKKCMSSNSARLTTQDAISSCSTFRKAQNDIGIFNSIQNYYQKGDKQKSLNHVRSQGELISQASNSLEKGKLSIDRNNQISMLKRIQEAQINEQGERESEKNMSAIMKQSIKKQTIPISFSIQNDYGLNMKQISIESMTKSEGLQVNDQEVHLDKILLKRNSFQLENNQTQKESSHSREDKAFLKKKEIPNIDLNSRLGMGEWKVSKQQIGEQQWQEKIDQLKASIKKKMPDYSTFLIKKWENYDLSPNNYSAKRSPKSVFVSQPNSAKYSQKSNLHQTEESCSKIENLQNQQQEYLIVKSKIIARKAKIEQMNQAVRNHFNNTKDKPVIPNELINTAKHQAQSPFFQIQNLKKEKHTPQFFPMAPCYSTQDHEEEVLNLKKTKLRSNTYKTFRNHVRSYLASQMD